MGSAKIIVTISILFSICESLLIDYIMPTPPTTRTFATQWLFHDFFSSSSFDPFSDLLLFGMTYMSCERLCELGSVASILDIQKVALVPVSSGAWLPKELQILADIETCQIKFTYHIDIQEEDPLSVLNSKLLGTALAVWSSKLSLDSLSSANGWVLPMWFCKFLFSLNAALQKLHWKYSINMISSTTVLWIICLLRYLERGFTGVGEHVYLKSTRSAKELSTFLTRELFLPTVNNVDVGVSPSLRLVDFSTILTCKLRLNL